MSSFKYNLEPSDTPSWNSGGTAGVLPKELQKATFEVEAMTNFLDGGKEVRVVLSTSSIEETN